MKRAAVARRSILTEILFQQGIVRSLSIMTTRMIPRDNRTQRVVRTEHVAGRKRLFIQGRDRRPLQQVSSSLYLLFSLFFSLPFLENYFCNFFRLLSSLFLFYIKRDFLELLITIINFIHYLIVNFIVIF